MTKYRIVEAKIPIQLRNNEMKYEYRYDIEYLDSLLFGLIKRWEKNGSFDTLEKAKKEIEFRKRKETWKIIDVD